MSLTVVSVAYPFARVGRGAVGGAEQILASHERELVARGCRSLVVACEGSTVAGRLLPTHLPPGVITPQVRRRVMEMHQGRLDEALSSGEADVVHMHGIDFFEYRIPPHIPVLVTLHLPPSWYAETIWLLPANYRLVCVSETQRQACPANVRDRLALVENGIPQADALPVRAKREFALMLSRICPEKNLHVGLDAARLAGVPVILGGEAFPYEDHLRYLREWIEPRLGAGASWPGALGEARKRRLLREARCLLLPTLAPETSSLVAMEAIAVGTPVIAYPSGAIPEIVDHGRTGFLVRSVEEMAEAIARVDEINPAECVAVAKARFPLQRMVDGYLAQYADMVAHRSQPASPGRAEEHA